MVLGVGETLMCVPARALTVTLSFLSVQGATMVLNRAYGNRGTVEVPDQKTTENIIGGDGK